MRFLSIPTVGALRGSRFVLDCHSRTRCASTTRRWPMWRPKDAQRVKDFARLWWFWCLGSSPDPPIMKCITSQIITSWCWFACATCAIFTSEIEITWCDLIWSDSWSPACRRWPMCFKCSSETGCQESWGTAVWKGIPNSMSIDALRNKGWLGD